MQSKNDLSVEEREKLYAQTEKLREDILHFLIDKQTSPILSVLALTSNAALLAVVNGIPKSHFMDLSEKMWDDSLKIYRNREKNHE